MKIFSKRELRNNLSRIPLANKILTERAIKISKRNINKIENYLKKKDINMVGPEDFDYISPENYSHCNIWGSGTSAAISKKRSIMLKNSFNIGIGFSYLLGIDFNFYFIENASNIQSELVRRQKKGIETFLDLEKCALVFKNIWEAKNNINFAIEAYKDIAFFARDFAIPHYFNKKEIYQNTTDLLLNHEGRYFKQACTTVLSSIIFANYLGFKKIVLHGVDFEGGYFFDTEEYKSLEEFRPPYFDGKLDIYNKKWRDHKKNHPTSNCLKTFLPIIDKKLKDQNVKLPSSLEGSKLSRIIKSFDASDKQIKIN